MSNRVRQGNKARPQAPHPENKLSVGRLAGASIDTTEARRQKAPKAERKATASLTDELAPTLSALLQRRLADKKRIASVLPLAPLVRLHELTDAPDKTDPGRFTHEACTFSATKSRPCRAPLETKRAARHTTFATEGDYAQRRAGCCHSSMAIGCSRSPRRTTNFSTSTG